jgi:hypothetical protein
MVFILGGQSRRMSTRRKHDPTVDVPRLYGAIAEGIVRAGIDTQDLERRLPRADSGVIAPARAKKGDGIVGHHGTVYETLHRVAQALYDMGLAVTPDLNNPYTWQLAVDGAEVNSFVAKRVQDGTPTIPPIDEFLSVFIGCADLYELLNVNEDETFVGDADLQDIFSELHHAGFLGRVHNQWRWTHRAATAMQTLLLWPYADEPEADAIRAGAFDAELREIIATMPKDVRNLGRQFYWGQFWLSLSHRWSAGRWGPAPVPGEHVTLKFSCCRAKRLMYLITLEDRASEIAIR